MSHLRSYVALCLPAFVACAGAAASPQIVIPLSQGAALSSPDSPGIGARLTFNGQTAWFVFDTGAGAHTLARWFVDAADLDVDSSMVGLTARDATGNPVALTVVQDLVAELGNDRKLSVGTAVVANFPPMFQAAQIGGLLNPQLLARDGEAVVLDMRVPELRIESFDQAVHRLGAKILAREELDICISAAAAIPNLVFAVAVGVGDREGRLQLDTGADVTTINRGSQLIRDVALEPGGQTMGIAGQAGAYELARNLVLTFAGHSVTTDAQVVESTGRGCGQDGLLGLDAIGRCALVLGPDAMAFACSP
jgi:hypothetical protein